MIHTPVLTKEVVKYLDPKPNENFIDCTIGQGGHAKLILEKTIPEGKVLGIDADPQQIENSKLQLENFKERIILINDSYSNLKDVIEKTNFEPISGILLDLGMSSEQLEESERGFSFQKDELLDMRYDNKNQNGLTAEKIINEWKQADIEEILKEYGEERFARQIANKIVEERKIKEIKSTFQLVEIIKKAVPAKFQFGRIHCATRVFQALRIAVNDELNNLIKVLPQIISVLSPGGRIVIISFHSLEDRIVKNFFKEKDKDKAIKILTKKPITADFEELRENSRSRSAKLRAAIKII
ncbi:MAG: 16S rRNA (cytosine(1402)-N(4))-methyltransferase RsmH [bacterium]|nr:16S rRNA (cytosine(1402)-N(4))-methyltransferase RsmH [bacterium]